MRGSSMRGYVPFKKVKVHIYKNPTGNWVLLDDNNLSITEERFQSADSALVSAREFLKNTKQDFEIVIHANQLAK